MIVLLVELQHLRVEGHLIDVNTSCVSPMAKFSCSCFYVRKCS